jgi:hypothetical protein
VKTERRFCASGDIMKITKTTVECYKVRDLKEGWANITIDDLGEKGRVQIASDFGDWQYYWNACGCPFKVFLTRLNLDYVADKFREDEHINIEKTIKGYKESVLQSRRFGDLKKKRARAVYDDIKQLQKDWWSPNDFKEAMHLKVHLLKYFDNMPEASYDVSPMFKRFWKEIWLPFMANLKNEIMANELAAVETI